MVHMRDDIEPARLLILPKAVLLQQQPESPYVARYLTFEEITGKASKPAELMQILATLRRSDVIRWVSTLLEVVSRREAIASQTQLGLARDLLEPELAARVLELASTTNEPWAVFHRRQLWLMLQLASLASGEGDVVEDDAYRYALGKACLMASDLLHSIEDVNAHEPGEGDESLKWLVAVMLSHMDLSNTNELLARGYALWVDSLTDENVRTEWDKLNVGANFDIVFHAAYGISLTEFLFISASLYLQCLMPATRPKVEPALIDVSIHSGGIYSEKDKDRVLSLLSISADSLAAHCLGTPRQSWASDFSPLQAHPLIEVFPSKVCCPDLGYFRLFFIDGIFWLMNAAMPSAKWRKFFGALYQWYITEMIKCFTVTSALLHRTFYSPVNFQSTNDEVCDGLIQTSDMSIVCEFKGTRLTTRQRAGIDISETIEAIEKSVGSEGIGIGQLAKSIARILKGEQAHSHEATIDMTKGPIIPALVWYEETAVTHATRLYLQEKFTALLSEKCPDLSRVGPLLLFTTRDIEVFDQFAKIESTDELFRDYVEFVRNNQRNPRSMFTAYIMRRFQGQELRKGFVQERLERVVREIVQRQNERAQRDDDANK